jgi:O-antigen/teichoic acid export membrane protein
MGDRVISQQGIMRRLLSSGAAATLGRVAGMGAQFACYALLARILTPSDFGAYVFASSIAIPLSALATIGLTRFAVRFVAEYLVTDSFAEVRQTLRLALGCGIVTIGLASLTCYAIVYAFNLSQPSKEPAPAALIAMWVACLAAGQLFAETVRGFHEVMVSSFMLGQGGGLIASVVLAVTLLSYPASRAPDLAMALRATVFSHAVLAPLSFVWLAFVAARNNCHLIGASHSVRRNRESSSGRLTDMIGVSLPVMLGYACAFVVMQGDIWIAYLVLDDASVALLGAARRLASIAAVPCYLATLAVMPMIPDLRARNQPKQLEQVLRTSAGGAAVLSLVVLAPLLLYPGGIAQLVYGPFFKDGAHLVFIASVGCAMFVAAGSSSTVLTLTGHQNVNLIIQLLSGTLLLSIGFAAAHFFGLTGLAVAGSLAIGLSSLLSIMAVRRCLGITAYPYLPWELTRHN